LKGAGTIASVQLARAVRGYRLLAELAFVVLVIAGAVYLRQGATGSIGHISLSNLVSVTIWTTVVVSNPLRFDFRGDLHNLEYLKTLPMPAWAVCIGQLMTPVFITLLYQMPFLVLASQVLRPALLLAAISLAIPLNVIWYSLENLGFLLYPTGQSGRGLGDVQYLGRQLLMLSVKLCCVAFAALLAVLLGLALAHFVTLDMTAFMVVVAATLVIEALLLVGVLAWVFKRFDPSPLQPSDA